MSRISKTDFKILLYYFKNYMCVYVSKCGYMHVSATSVEAREGGRSTGDGIIDGFELPDVGDGNQS